MEKTFNYKEFEDKIYSNWLDKGYFKAKVNKEKRPFTIIMPPPNITGQLHIGHALDLSIQDSIIRYKRMLGFETLYMPGTDHASIATELKITQMLNEKGINKKTLGREEFLKKAYEWNDKYGLTIVNQQKKLGLSCDWDKSAFTMDENRSKAVKEVFINMFEKGLIYKGERIINWCPSCKTALSDAEVNYEKEDSFLYHIKYPFENCEAIKGEGFLTVATTRPETMLGDTAVAVNPKDSRYKNLIGKNLILPLTDRKIPIIADSYVEIEFGSGAVKITPAHDVNDFEVGLRHDLSVIKVIDDNGIMNENASIYKGLNRSECRKKIVEDLERQGFLIEKEKYSHNVGHCYRCKDIIEPSVSKQWFMKMNELIKPAIDAVKKGEIKFIPKRFEKLYMHWMQNTRDWCISRQLWWGHRIPVYYCESCDKYFASKDDISTCPDCKKQVFQDEDVLDTWFSSALWPFSTLNWPQKSEELNYFYPTNVLVTAYDIIGFWVSRMIISGIKHLNKPPFSEVLIHGIVRDNLGKKMSKSSDNGIDPLEAIEKMGADALRFSLIMGVSMGSDTKYSEEKLESARNFINKIWNASRFVLTNSINAKIYEIDQIKNKLSLSDKRILGKLSEVTKSVTRLMDKYEVGLASNIIYEFIWNEFCDWYIEESKISLFDESKRDYTLSVLNYVLRESLKLAHPIIPFITAEIYNNLPNKDAEDIMVAPYPKFKTTLFKSAIKDMKEVIALIKSVRNLKSEMNASSKKTALFILPVKEKEKLIFKTAPLIEKLSYSKDVKIIDEKMQGNKYATLITNIAQCYIHLEDLIDFKEELNRLKNELLLTENEIERAKGKLNNQGFVAKAPKNVIEAEREKLDKYLEQKERISESIKKIENM